ncbi:hypothetical protein Tco_1307255, partial [Tanacetum coccineum]
MATDDSATDTSKSIMILRAFIELEDFNSKWYCSLFRNWNFYVSTVVEVVCVNPRHFTDMGLGMGTGIWTTSA